MVLADVNGAARVARVHPADWPLRIQVDLIDPDNGQTVASFYRWHAGFTFTNWHLPATTLAMPLEGEYGKLRMGHSYKMVLTVLDEMKDLGSAKASVRWVKGEEIELDC